MTDEETLIMIGLLVQEARKAKGQNRKESCEGMTLGYQTMQMVEHGKLRTIPNKRTLKTIEDYYGWKPGVLADIWAHRRSLRDGETTLQDLQASANQGVLEARHLTDDQLIHELAFRLIMKNTD